MQTHRHTICKHQTPETMNFSWISRIRVQSPTQSIFTLACTDSCASFSLPIRHIIDLIRSKYQYYQQPYRCAFVAAHRTRLCTEDAITAQRVKHPLANRRCQSKRNVAEEVKGQLCMSPLCTFPMRCSSILKHATKQLVLLGYMPYYIRNTDSHRLAGSPCALKSFLRIAQLNPKFTHQAKPFFQRLQAVLHCQYCSHGLGLEHSIKNNCVSNASTMH